MSGAIGMSAWLLYPRTLFLGYLHEGRSNLDAARADYENVVLQHPADRNATRRLAALYERMGDPISARRVYEQLLLHRPRDFALANEYLGLLERAPDHRTFERARLEIIARFQTAPYVTAAALEPLISAAYHTARWAQDRSTADALLAWLCEHSRDAGSYRDEQFALALADHDTPTVRAALETQLTAHPHRAELCSDLAQVYADAQERDAAFAVLDRCLEQTSDDAALLAHTGMAIAERTAAWERVLSFVDRFDAESAATDDAAWRALTTRINALEHLARGADALATATVYVHAHADQREAWQLWLDLSERHTTLPIFLPRLLHYLDHFPHDSDRVQQLISLTLYRTRDLQYLPRWRAYIVQSSDARLALDVAELLIDTTHYDRALAWLHDFRAIIPQRNFLQLAMRIHERLGNMAAALAAGEIYAHAFPNDCAFGWTLVGYADQLHTPSVAHTALQQLARCTTDPLAVAKEFFWRGWWDDADALLTTQIDHASATERGRLLAWRSEVRAGAQHTREAKLDAIAALAAWSLPNDDMIPTALDDTRLWLRLHTRTGRDATSLYDIALTRWPQDRELSSDAVYAALEHHTYARAARVTRTNAVALPPITTHALHALADRSVDATFHAYSLGEERGLWGAVSAAPFITDRWRGELAATFGVFRSPVDGNVERSIGNLRAGTLWAPRARVEVGGGIRAGADAHHALLISPDLHARVGNPDRATLTCSAAYGAPWLDSPLTAATSVRRDQMEIVGEASPFQRLRVSARYTADHVRAPDVDAAWLHTLEPRVAWTFMQHPAITLAYQLTWQRLVHGASFSTRVPLLSRMQTHYLIAELVQHFGAAQQHTFDANLFLGDDSQRDLHIWRAQILGTHVGLRTALTQHIDAHLTYDFGRETSTVISGTRHEVALGFSYHWE